MSRRQGESLAVQTEQECFGSTADHIEQEGEGARIHKVQLDGQADVWLGDSKDIQSKT
jgi:hypothetical protein